MLGELQPWFSGWSSQSPVDQFRKNMDELLDRFFSDFGYRGPAASMTMWPAVESFLKDHEQQAVTAALDRIYGEEPSALEPGLAQLQAAHLPKDEW